MIQAPDAHSVSLLMAVRDGGLYLAEALETILAQSRVPCEIVVVDDGSLDGTADILETFRRRSDKFPFRIVSLPPSGLAKARNAAVEAAQGTLLVFMDADDIADPDMIASMVSVMEQDADIALAFCCVRHIDADGTPTGLISKAPPTPVTSADFLISNPMHATSGTIMRAEAVRRVGGFDESLSAMADLDLAVRIGHSGAGRLHCEDRILIDYRRHSGQVTSDWRRLRKNWERVFDKAKVTAPDIALPIEREALARNGVYWATMAYQAGDFPASRRLIAEAWRRAPEKLVRNGQAVIRALACAASVLPRQLHDELRRGVNALQRR